jgi:hypothetical protein
VALAKGLGINWRHLLDLVTKRKQISGHVVSDHASFDPDEAWRYVHEAYGNSVPGNFLTQNDRALLIVQRVLAGIDTDCADNCDVFFARHGMCSSYFKTPEPILSVVRGRSTAGPSHSRHCAALRYGGIADIA